MANPTTGLIETSPGGRTLVQNEGLNTAKKFNLNGVVQGDGTGTNLGLVGVTPVAQPASPTGNVHTPTAGSTTNVFVNTTFDGSIGSTAYTIGDIVIALKNLGILAQ